LGPVLLELITLEGALLALLLKAEEDNKPPPGQTVARRTTAGKRKTSFRDSRMLKYKSPIPKKQILTPKTSIVAHVGACVSMQFFWFGSGSRLFFCCGWF
jgi:hypothetical protein